LAAVGSGARDEQEKQAYFSSLLGIVDKKFEAVAQVTRAAMQESVKAAIEHTQSAEMLLHVQDALDMFAGLSSAIDPVTNQDCIYPFIARHFEDFMRYQHRRSDSLSVFM
jgi:hypothetical protein